MRPRQLRTVSGSVMGAGAVLAIVLASSCGGEVDAPIPSCERCAPEAVCTDGSCVCSPGFTGDGETCVREVDAGRSMDAGAPDAAGEVDAGLEPSAVAEVAMGSLYSCARSRDGSVRCWGWNGSAQLGTPGGSQSIPVLVPVIDDAVELALGSFHACARRASGIVTCWGDNRHGQSGNGSVSTIDSDPGGPPVAGLDDAVHVASGGAHACAVRASGAVVCWGQGEAGQLGDGDTVSRAAPVVVAGLPAAVQIAAGSEHTCALTRDGQVYCWGRNNFGQLGIGAATVAVESTPVLVPDLSEVTEVTAAQHHACARRSGTIRCWGDNRVGQLGLAADAIPHPSPEPAVSLPGSASHVAAGVGFTCAIVGGEGFCWGINSEGQLGDGSSGGATHEPQRVLGLTSVESIVAGFGTACARAPGALCWGRNDSGQVGDGTTTQRNEPTPVVGLD